MRLFETTNNIYRWNTEMGMRSTNAVCEQDFPVVDAADILMTITGRGNGNHWTGVFGMYLFVPETYDVCGVHTGICKGVVDHITLANCWQIPLL